MTTTTVEPAPDQRWHRPALAALLGATALLYVWGLGASGYANSFYAAAVQAGTHSLKAAFFGASDAAGSITVDKSPLFLWPMEISARIFGVNGWSLLVPQALEGVLSVAFLYAAIKRWFGVPAGLIAGAVLALTPAAALMFRFNNPDALLVLLLTMAGYAMVRALESGHTKWVALCFALVGLGFLAKMLQAFLVVPAFGFAYLLAGPPELGRRIYQLAVGAVAMFAAASWWVAIVELTPKSMRPYIGGSQNNSVLNLIFGYNGFGRLTGQESGSVGGRTSGGRWGPTGLLRMFNREFGGQASWLIPTALALLVIGTVYTARRPRTDRTRAALIMWGGWLVFTALTFSLGRGIIHEYYTVALAPGIGGTVGVGCALLWRERENRWARVAMVGVAGVTAWWSLDLLHRRAAWNPWLTSVVLGGTAVAVVFLVVGSTLGKRVLTGAVVGAVAVGLVGPAAYSLDTASIPHTGAIPNAGPRRPARRRLGGFGLGGGVLGGFGLPTFVNGGSFARPARSGLPSMTGPGGSLLAASRPDKTLTDYLERNEDKFTWIAATVGSNEAAGYQLATDRSVMPIGGFNGTDPAPTLTQFQADVTHERIHYFISGGRTLGKVIGNPDTATTIRQWVESTFTSTTFGNVRVFDLTSPLATATAI